jgi:hypothetical protein
MLTGPRKRNNSSIELSAAERSVLASIENLIAEGGEPRAAQKAHFLRGILFWGLRTIS